MKSACEGTETSGLESFRLAPPDRSAGSSAQLPLVLGVIGAIGGIAAVSLAAAGGAAGLVAFLGGLSAALAWYVVALLVIVRGGRRGWVRLRARSNGLTLVASLASPVGGIGAAVILVSSAAWLGIRAFSIGDNHDVRWFIGMASIALFAVANLLRSGRASVRPSALGLNPNGLELSEVGLTELAWDDVAVVGFDRKGMAFTTSGGTVHFRPGDLRSDPFLVAELIDYYRCHPGQRDELGDHRAIQRIRLHQFVATTIGGVGP